MAKRAATDKATSENLVCQLRKATECIASQKDKLQPLKIALGNKDAIIRKIQNDYSLICQEKKALEQDFCKAKSQINDLKQTIDEKDATIQSYKRDSTALNANIVESARRQEEMVIDMKQLKKEKDNVLKTSRKLRLENERLYQEYELLRENHACKLKSMSKVNQIKEAKKRYKKQVRHLSKFVQDIKEQLLMKDRDIESKSREVLSLEDELITLQKISHSSQKTNQDLEAQVALMEKELKYTRGQRDALMKRNEDLLALNTHLSKLIQMQSHLKNYCAFIGRALGDSILTLFYFFSALEEEYDSAKKEISALQTKLDERRQKAKMALSQLCEDYIDPSHKS